MTKLLFLSLFLGASLFGSTIEEGLKKVSLHEKICMKHFFDSAIRTDQAAHVLYFNTKPVCFTGVVLKDRHRKFEDVLCLKGWRAFKKTGLFFQHPRFLFNEELYEGDNLKLINIYIVNKESMTKCLNEHATRFKEILGQDFNPKQFMSQLQSGHSLTSLIQSNEMLLGILLGFGEEASKAYVEEHRASVIPKWTDTYCGIQGKRPQKCTIHPVGFMGNPHSLEIRELMSTYDAELEEIWELYRSKISLKEILETLCS